MTNKWLAVAVVSVGIVWLYLSRDTFDPESVRGKRVLVTGASCGIGEQLAYRYAELGARLLLTARRLPQLEEVAAKCRRLGAPHVDVVAGDMMVAEDRAAVVGRARDHLGGLDHLILNHANVRAGWWLGSAGNLSDLQADVTLNFLSYVDLASRALPLLNRSRGSIGVMSSGFGEIGVARGTTYSANKHALHGFFSSWRQELRHRNVPVSVTLCVLGPVSTQNLLKIAMTFTGSVPKPWLTATPEDAADAVVRGVTTRVPKFRYNRVISFLLALNDLTNVLGEDVMNWFLFNVL